MENKEKGETTPQKIEEKPKETPKENPPAPQNIDYKAELLRLQAEKKNAEAAIMRHKRKEKESQEEMDDDAIDEIKERIDREVGERLSLAEKKFSLEASKIAIRSQEKDSTKADLIIFHLENSIRPSGNIDEDVKRAKALVESEYLIQENAELKRSRQTTPPQGGGQAGEHTPTQAPKEGELSQEDIAFAKKFGIDPTKLKTPSNIRKP